MAEQECQRSGETLLMARGVAVTTVSALGMVAMALAEATQTVAVARLGEHHQMRVSKTEPSADAATAQRLHQQLNS